MPLSPELIEQLRTLSDEQKREAIWFLADELGIKQGLETADLLYAIHFNGVEAAAQLMKAVEEHKQRGGNE